MAGWTPFIGGGTVTPAPRRPSSLLQCMDTDQNGNLQIDAFRYIEYSRQRRMEFMKRANFICTMNSSLQANAKATALAAGQRRMTAPVMPMGMWNLNRNATIDSPLLSSMAATNTAPLSTTAAMNRVLQQQPSLASAMAQRIVEDRSNREFGSTLLTRQNMAAWEQLERLKREQQYLPVHDQAPPKQQRRLEEFEAAEALLFSRFSSGPIKECATEGASYEKRNDGASADDNEQREGTGDSLDSTSPNDSDAIPTSAMKASSSKTKRKKLPKTENGGTNEGPIRKPRKKRARKE